MICVDTTVLIDLWRGKDDPKSAARAVLRKHAGEVFVVPVAAAGEFLEGAAYISNERLQEALLFLDMFEIAPSNLETAVHYARSVSAQRRAGKLRGASKFDLWNAATALEHGARFITRNARDFASIPALQVETYPV